MLHRMSASRDDEWEGFHWSVFGCWVRPQLCLLATDRLQIMLQCFMRNTKQWGRERGKRELHLLAGEEADEWGKKTRGTFIASDKRQWDKNLFVTFANCRCWAKSDLLSWTFLCYTSFLKHSLVTWSTLLSLLRAHGVMLLMFYRVHQGFFCFYRPEGGGEDSENRSPEQHAWKRACEETPRVSYFLIVYNFSA